MGKNVPLLTMLVTILISLLYMAPAQAQASRTWVSGIRRPWLGGVGGS